MLQNLHTCRTVLQGTLARLLRGQWWEILLWRLGCARWP